MNTFKWGIIGPGRIAEKFTEAVNGLSNIEVHAVASTSLDRANKFAKENNIPKFYENYKEMLQEANIDAVYISTVNSAHYDNIMLCLDMGIPVLCEKPMVMKLDEFDKIMNKAREKKIPLMEAMWTNFIPSIKGIKKLIYDGDIGKASLAFIDFCVKFDQDPASRIYNKDLGGGLLFDIGVYNLHTVFNLFGEEYEDIVICGRKGETSVDAASFISFSYPNGLIVNTTTSGETKGPYGMRIYGDKGSIVSDNYNDSQEYTFTYDTGVKIGYRAPYKVNGFEYEIEEFVDMVNSSKTESDIVSLSRSRKVCEIMEMGYNKICNS